MKHARQVLAAAAHRTPVQSAARRAPHQTRVIGHISCRSCRVWKEYEALCIGGLLSCRPGCATPAHCKSLGAWGRCWASSLRGPCVARGSQVGLAGSPSRAEQLLNQQPVRLLHGPCVERGSEVGLMGRCAWAGKLPQAAAPTGGCPATPQTTALHTGWARHTLGQHVTLCLVSQQHTERT